MSIVFLEWRLVMSERYGLKLLILRGCTEKPFVGQQDSLLIVSSDISVARSAMDNLCC